MSNRFNNILINAIHHSGVTYPVPVNLTYWWNFGVLALFCLVIQLISGIFLAMHYVPNADLAFNSVEHIMRDINNGWFLRYLHANGASMFFLVVYIHLFRGLYYGSYSQPRQLVWCTGVVILFIMILTAFMGYVLPWGQMSFWAATVITNLVSAIPYIGQDILNWLWGGYAVDNATLNRFFSFHYLFPFILTGIVGVHIIYLHEHGSNNNLGIIFNIDKIPFTPYFTIKDIFGVIVFLILFSYFIFFDPVYLGHPDNFIPANPLVTPAHIVPEWYFLPFYAILRSVPDKLFGVLLLLGAIIVLFIFPFILKININSGYLRPLYQIFFWFFFFNSILLGWIGGKAIEAPFYLLGQIFTIFYFLYFLIILPLLSYFENFFYMKNVRLKKNKYNLIDNSHKENNNIFFKSIFIFISLLQSMFIFLDGDRIPNLSILCIMFLGYNFFVNKNIFVNIYNVILNNWLFYIKVIKYYLNTLNILILFKKILNYFYLYFFFQINQSILVLNFTKLNKLYKKNFYLNFFFLLNIISLNILNLLYSKDIIISNNINNKYYLFNK